MFMILRIGNSMIASGTCTANFKHPAKQPSAGAARAAIASGATAAPRPAMALAIIDRATRSRSQSSNSGTGTNRAAEYSSPDSRRDFGASVTPAVP